MSETNSATKLIWTAAPRTDGGKRGQVHTSTDGKWHIDPVGETGRYRLRENHQIKGSIHHCRNITQGLTDFEEQQELDRTERKSEPVVIEVPSDEQLLENVRTKEQQFPCEVVTEKETDNFDQLHQSVILQAQAPIDLDDLYPMAVMRSAESRTKKDQSKRTLAEPGQLNDLVAELVCKYGSGFRWVSAAEEVLTRFGFKLSDVTEEMINRGVRIDREKLRDMARANNQDPSSPQTVVIVGDPEFDPSFKRRENEMSVAAVEEKVTFQIKESVARELLMAMGSETSGRSSVTPKKLAGRLLTLTEEAASEGLRSPDSPDLALVFKRLTEAVAEGQKIEVVAEAVAEGQKVEAVTEAVTETPVPVAETNGNGNGHTAPKVEKKKKAVAKEKVPEPEVAPKTGRGRPKGSTMEPKAAKKISLKGEGRPKVFGRYTQGTFARWLGSKGVDFENAKKILSKETIGGFSLSDLSIKLELKEKRPNKLPADVSKEDVKIVKEKYPEAFSTKKTKTAK